MKNLKAIFSYIPKQFYMTVAAVVALAIPVAVFGSWSPGRATFTIDNPADYVTFNSITDNPNYGDERPFHDVKDASNTSEGGFQDVMEVEDEQELLLRAYVHNNASADLNESGDGIAKNTEVEFMIPNGTETNLRAISYISADNAKPQVVSDTIDLFADKPFSLEYVEGSARQYTNDVPSGRTLSDSIVNGGAPLTSDGADSEGDYLGCFEFTSIVTIKVKVNMSDINVTKMVKVNGSDADYETTNTANVGDTLNYKIEFTNTGDTRLENVTVGDNLPAFMTYVEDSTYVANGANDFVPEKQSNNNITRGGIDIGNYGPGANAFVYFQATIDEALDEECGVATLRNVILAKADDTNNYQNAAITEVDTGNECEEPKDVQVCDPSTGDIITVPEDEVDQYEPVDSDKCEDEEPKDVEVCDPATGEIITVKEDQADQYEPKDSDSCKDDEVDPAYACKMLTAEEVSKYEYRFTVDASASNGASIKNYIFNYGDGSDEFVTDNETVTHTYSEDGEYMVSVNVNYDVNGETVTDTSDDCKVKVTIDTPETPEEPEEEPEDGPEVLASTGPAEAVMAVFGTGALGQGVRAWITSRKRLIGSLLG